MNRCIKCEAEIIPAWRTCRECDKTPKEENYERPVIVDEHVQLMGDYIRLTELYAQQQTLIETLMRENALLKNENV